MPWCLIVGHRWRVFRTLEGTGHLRTFHPLAGCDAFCERCGRVWLDYDFVARRRAVYFPELLHLDDEGILYAVSVRHGSTQIRTIQRVLQDTREAEKKAYIARDEIKHRVVK